MLEVFYFTKEKKKKNHLFEMSISTFHVRRHNLPRYLRNRFRLDNKR